MSEQNGNGRERERVEVNGEPVIHPPARTAAKAINKAMKAMSEVDGVSAEALVQLSVAISLLNISETLGTAHYEAKERLGMIGTRGTTSADSSAKGEIPF